MELRVGGRYRLGRKIGSGSFGDIYQGFDVLERIDVAIKLEPVNTALPQLSYEASVYNQLRGCPFLPVLKWFGRDGDFRALVMELLGPSLEDLFQFLKRKFSLKTILMLVVQMINHLKLIHKKDFIHRDIKPDNFLMGLRERAERVHLIDFGLAKRYVDYNGEHISYREGKNLTGTIRYTSLNAHRGSEQSRRDDLESLAYVLIYFANGSLPWQGVRGTTKLQKYSKIAEIKLSTPIDVLCEGLPEEFAIFLMQIRNLSFNKVPEYSNYMVMFQRLMVRKGFQFDLVYDWSMHKGGTRSWSGSSGTDSLTQIAGATQDTLPKPRLSRPPVNPNSPDPGCHVGATTLDPRIAPSHVGPSPSHGRIQQWLKNTHDTESSSKVDLAAALKKFSALKLVGTDTNRVQSRSSNT